MRISIQGIKGAFHQEAAKKYFEGQIEILPQLSFKDVAESVINKQADYGMMAIENTISGTIHNNLNLIRQSNLHISGEVYLHIQQNLAALPGTRMADIQQVHSHYMAINQCREYFLHFPHIKLVDSEDTALSMKMVAERQARPLAAIGSKLAADLYGLEILAESIETNKKNYTRFLVVENKKTASASNYDKASLAVLLPHQKGSLAKVLSMIDFYHINLSKIESLPIIGEPWHYLFYIDVLFENSKVYQQMLEAIQPMVDELQILGEYTFGAHSFREINQSTIH